MIFGCRVEYLLQPLNSHGGGAETQVRDVCNLPWAGTLSLRPIHHEIFARVDQEGRNRRVLSRNGSNDGYVDAG